MRYAFEDGSAFLFLIVHSIVNDTAACPNVARIDRPPALERTQASLGHGMTATLRRLRECALVARIWPHFLTFRWVSLPLQTRPRWAMWTSELRDENLTA